jgi:hypothetical protein
MKSLVLIGAAATGSYGFAEIILFLKENLILLFCRLSSQLSIGFVHGLY